MDARALSLPISALAPQKPCCVELGTPVSKVIELMQKGGFGGVLVVSNQQIMGIITERDLASYLMGLRLNPDEVIVDDVMTASPESLSDDDPIAFALNLMHLGRFRHIPLVDEESGVPTGMVSSKDIVKHIAKSMEANLHVASSNQT